MRTKSMAVIRIAGWILSGLFLIWLYVMYMEHFGIYYPLEDITDTPASIGLKYKDVTINTNDGETLRGWYLPAVENNRIILFFSGNAGNRSYRLDKLQILLDLNVSLLIADYRGYGGSTGRPSEKGLYEDGRSIWKHAVNDMDYSPEDIILYGESLGGAVAVDVSKQKDVGAVIIEGTMSSGRDMARQILPFIPRFMVSDIYNSRKKVPHINTPLLILHSRKDAIIPYEQGKKLYEAAQEPVRIATLKGDHNHAFLEDQQTYRKAIEDFLQDF